MQKIMIFKAKFPKNGKFQGIFFFAFFASFSLQRIFFAKIFFVCKESLFVIHYSTNVKKVFGNESHLKWIYVFWCDATLAHSGPENKKKSRAKKNSWNKINQFHEIFLTKFHFLQFQKWPKINFWTGKKFKTAKNAN